MQRSTAKQLIKMTNELYEKEALSFDKTRGDLWEKEILDFTSKIEPGFSVLDLGCGNARLYQFLSNKSIKYLGIDVSKKLIALNRKKYPTIQFRVGDGLKFPPEADQPLAEKNKFNYVISIAVLHHIPSEELQLKFLKNIYNALKPNGKTLITVWNRWQTKLLHRCTDRTDITDTIDKKILLGLDKNDQIIPWKQSKQFRYIHAFKPQELKNLAQKAGFKKTKVFSSKHGKITNLDSALNIYLEAEK